MKKLSRAQIDNFWARRAKIANPRISTHFKEDDTHIFDLNLIRQYCNKKSRILDVGCGTCYLSNNLVDDVSFIKAIDKFSKFLKFCRKSPKIKTEVSDILDYRDNRKYDLIIMFGVIMYFDESDTDKIYYKYSRLLKKGGVLIVKHQCGITDDVYINKYSDQIQDNYQALYKSVEKDKQLLSAHFQNVKTIDIYPSRLNPWPNTHFFAFICSQATS